MERKRLPKTVDPYTRGGEGLKAEGDAFPKGWVGPAGAGAGARGAAVASNEGRYSISGIFGMACSL